MKGKAKSKTMKHLVEQIGEMEYRKAETVRPTQSAIDAFQWFPSYYLGEEKRKIWEELKEDWLKNLEIGKIGERM